MKQLQMEGCDAGRWGGGIAKANQERGSLEGSKMEMSASQSILSVTLLDG